MKTLFIALLIIFLNIQINSNQTVKEEESEKESNKEDNEPIIEKAGKIDQVLAVSNEFIDEKDLMPINYEKQCKNEIIHSYRLNVFQKTENTHINYICPYIKERNECCDFGS